MIAKRWLKNIAAGLLDSFISRNNDFIGYWAPGVLHTETLHAGKRVDIDLLAAGAVPATPAACHAALFWTARLREAMCRHGGGLGDLEVATMSIEFGLPPRPRRLGYVEIGEPFVCSLRLVSRSGPVIVGQRLGYCLPHELHDGRRSSRYRP